MTSKKAPIIDRKLLDYIGEDPRTTPYEWVIRLRDERLLSEGIDVMRLRELVFHKIYRIDKNRHSGP